MFKGLIDTTPLVCLIKEKAFFSFFSCTDFLLSSIDSNSAIFRRQKMLLSSINSKSANFSRQQLCYLLYAEILLSSVNNNAAIIRKQ